MSKFDILADISFIRYPFLTKFVLLDFKSSLVFYSKNLSSIQDVMKI